MFIKAALLSFGIAHRFLFPYSVTTTFDTHLKTPTLNKESLTESLYLSPPFLQINELSHVQIPIMLMPDDFKAYSKIKVDNHLFNK